MKLCYVGWHCWHLQTHAEQFTKAVHTLTCAIERLENWERATFHCCQCARIQQREQFVGTGYEGIGS